MVSSKPTCVQMLAMEIRRPHQDVSFQHGLKNYRNESLIILLVLLPALALTAAGCVSMTDYEASQEQTSDSVATVDLRNSVGQTFTSRRPELNGITLWLTPVDNENNPCGG